MSEIKHTPEPWIAVPGKRHDPEVIITTQYRLDQSKGEICGMDVEFTGPHGDEQKANARRIVACVNALAHVSTEQLESGELLHMGQVIKDMTRQRDAALADAETILAQGHRLALELECLLLDTKDTAAVSKWWDSAQDALQDWRGCVQQSAENETQASLMLTDETQTGIPAIVFYPAGSLGEEVQS